MSSFAVRLILWLALTALMLMLAWAVWVYNLERACILRQWPELASCTNRDSGVSGEIESLRKHIRRNPGDSEAWIQLAMRQSSNKVTGFDDATLDTATQLAGQDPRLQRMQATRAIQRQQWPQAIEWLVRLVQDSDDGRAAVAIAASMREPEALAALQNQIKPGARSLGPTINAMPQARVPVVVAMPLVVRALSQQGISPELMQQLLQQLKADGQWLEARALWAAWLGRPADLIFNGNFNTGFIPGGFDWEVMPAPPSKAGALVRQVALNDHGGVLQVEFTGRPLTVPLVRQHLVLLHKHFVLSGRFMTASLRANEGLAWVLNCVNGGGEIARTPALKDTSKLWQPFNVEFVLPSGCGNAVALQLQTFAPYESSTGLRGQATFDDLKLEARP